MTPTSPLFRLIDDKVGGLDEFVASRRPQKTWQEIADEIRELTGEAPTRETVRLWFADRLITETRVA